MSRNGEAGQALVLAALGLTVLMLAAGLAIDMGYLRYQSRRMQTAADSAAIAGATQLGGDWSDAALTDAGLNGFTNAVNGTIVTPTSVQCPDGTANCVQVQVSQPQPTFFMRIVGNNMATVSTQAVAEQGPGLGCLYALDTGTDSVEMGYVGPEAVVAGTTCGVVANGGLEIQNSLSHTIYAQSVGVGSYNGWGTVTPTPFQGITSAGDPFASLSPPSSPPACGGGGPTVYATTSSAPSGTYPCGLTLNPGPSATISLSGLYTVGGTGLTISGSGSVTGNGVTFYVSGASAAVSINPSTDETMNNFGAAVQLQAPADASSGGIPGVLLFQDRSDTQGGTVTLAGFPSGNSNPDSYLWGALYVPAATLTLDGIGIDQGGGVTDRCSAVPRLTTVVAYQLVLEENLNFSTNDCQWPPTPVSVPVPSVTKNAVLVR
jgi:Flp pilus assembly protein TadG